MDYFRIQINFPLSRRMLSTRLHTLKSESIQAAIDTAYSREIYRGEKILEELSRANKEPVLKREDFGILPIARYDGEDESMKESFSLFNSNDEYKYVGPKYTHPSRLTDGEIKQLLLADASVNKEIDTSTLDGMIFLI